MAHLEQDEKTGKLKWIRDEEDTPGWIKNMASNSNDAWRAVEDWFNSWVSDEQKKQWWIPGSLYRAADSVNNVVWSIIWETISAFWNAPKFFTDAIDSVYYDNVNWWWSDLKKEADKKQDEWASWLSAWTDTVAENSNTEWADNQSLAWETINQAINWPLLWLVWKWINRWSKWIRWLWNWLTKLTTHWDDVVKVTPKFWNIIDDAIKWGTKTSEEIFEWTTKIWWRTDDVLDTSKIFSKTDDVLWAWEKAVENVAAKNPSVLSKVWNWTKNTLKKTWDEASPFILWPIKSASDIATAWLKAWYNTYRASWIWAGVIEWITTTMEKSLNFASDFATKPLSFRTPAIWEAKMSSDITWEWYWVYDKNRDLKNFYDDHWYSLEEANAYKDDESLTEWYDKRNIDEDKRLTKAEVEQMLSEVWKNKFTDTMTSWYNSLTLFDPFTSPNLIASSRAWENIEAEKNPRWETIWFVELSDWTTADFSDLDNIIVKDKDWNDLSPEDLTEENIIELESFIKESFWSFDEEEQIPQDDQTSWWDDNNILMTQLNSWSTDWMISADTMSEIVNWKNTWSHDVWIATKLQEWTKQYASNIIALYTKDALEKDPQLQREVVNSLNAYSKLFNWTIDIINNLDEKDYEKDVYEFRKALTESYNNLSAADKDLINANLYQKAIDYNNWLESWIDEWLMKTATWWKRAVDFAFGLIKSDDRTMWYDQWLQWLWSTLINPDTRWWSSMMNDVWTHLEAQEATIATTLIANRINNSVIEKIPAKWIDAVIKKNPELNTKWMTFIKWATSEMASEPLENFIDQVSLVDSADHDYDYWNWLLFGMFQWWLAWYAWSRNSYSSINDYFSKPENRKTILENMWIYIDQIKDDQQRAVALSITNQMFDSVVDIMKQVTAETNNWVEAIMQWFAIYQTESMLWDYAVWVIWQMIDAVNARDKALWWNWTENDILWIFETVDDFNNYNAGKSFNFSQSFVDAIRNSRENTEKLNQIRNVATAYINSSFKTAWMSLEDWINFMAPKIYEASGKKVSIPLFNKKISDNQIVDQLTWDKYFDIVTIYAWTNQIAPTIWEKMWITKDNDLVYWEHKRVADIKWVPLRYNSFLKITTKTKWYRPTVKLDSWEEISMRDYIIRQLNDPNTNLTDDERMFISTILFKTTVSWYNHYFNDDGSLSRLWEDFFEQVLPQLEWLNTPKKLFDKLSSIQRLKEAESETSERKALQESKANENQVEVLRLEWWTNVKNWDDITDLPDSQPLPIENNWQQVFVKDLRDAWSLEVKDWNTKYTYTVDRDWQSETLSITKKESSDSLYWMSQWIIYSEDQEIQNQYEAYMNRWFFNSTIPQSLEREYIWDNPSNEYNDMRIRELKSKIEKKLNKTSFWSWEARWMASWLQELNIRLAHQQQVAQEQEWWYVMKKWWAWTTTITDNDVSTREVNVPISASSSDYPELKEWEFREAYELVAAQDAAKKKIPYLDQTKITVWIEDWAQWIEWFSATKADIKKQSGEINSESYWKTLPVVEIEAKDDDWNSITKRYRAVRIWDSSIKDWNNSKGKNRDFIFKSFVLVDFENWESVNKYSTKAIRPSKYPKDYVFYSDNNIVIEVLWADKKPLNENRVVMFTKWNKKWEDRQVWRMSTTVQYDRLSEHDQDIAVSKSRIFMNENNSDPKTRTKWYLWPQEIVYDARYIYTTSDVVFNDHNLRFRMWDVSVDLSTKNYNAEKLSRQLSEQDSEWLQKQLKTIWKLTQTISNDWAVEQSASTSTTDEIVENIEPVSEKSTPQEVKNELRTVDKTVEQQYNYWLEKAKADDANPTKSVAESAMDNISPIQTSLFWWPSLDSIKSSVEDRLNQLIKISIREDKINDRIEDIEEDIKDLENEENPDQEDIDSLNSEKNELVDQLETLSTFKKIVDESEEFETVEQYLNSELDRLKEWDTNTIMNMASQYWILEWVSNTIESQYDYEWEQEYLSSIQDNPYWAEMPIRELPIKENTQELEAIVDQTPVAALPSPSELLEQTSAPNEVIASNYLSTDDKIRELADDCKKLHITLDALSPQQLAVVIQAYEQWLWINYVIEQFSKDLLTSKVDYKLVDALTKKWILRKDVEYDWLTISQMINYTALINDQNKKNIYAMVDPNELNSKTWRSVVDEITKYYIRNYFNYNPNTIDPKLKARIKKMIEEKLLDSDIFVAEKWNTTLDVDSDLQTILSIESLNPELKKTFAQSAYNIWLISATRYNYLMWSNPYIANIDNGDYNPWIIASTIISSMNKIPEFAVFDSDTANQNKIQLIWDVYNYFSMVSRWSTYEWLIKYLKRIHKWSSKEMKNMIAVLENDQKETTNLIHSEEVMNVFWWNSTTYQNSPYENFIKDKWDNEDAIIEALIELEKDDVPSFLQIIKTAPWDIRRPIYQRFYQDNKLNHWKNLAYWLVSMLLNNYKEVEEALKDEKKSKTLSDDALYLLRNFDRRSLINPLVTQQLIKELWIRWLDPNLWTVILTDNYQDSLWRWMKNFDNVKRFELLPVSSLSSIKMNVNVIVPKWVSIPKVKEWTFNIVRYNEAWYKNWAMVVRTYDWSEYNMTDRVFNIIWMNWFRVEYRQWWLDRSQRQIVIDNKENKSLYWNIFKYNIMPNLWLDQQDIKQEEFEAVIDPNRMKDVRNTTLYNAFTARNINELVDASVKLINHITNWQLWLTSNLEWWRKSVAVKPAIDSFVAFVKREFNTSTQRELVLNAFSEYLMMQLKLENTDRWQRFHDFCERHNAAIRLLADKYKDRSERWWNISDLFVNIDQLIERPTSPLEEYNVDKSIATEEDLKVIADVNKKIKDARKLAKEKEAAYYATDWKTSTPEERSVRAKLYREWQNALDDIEDLIVDRDEMYESTMTSDQEAMQEELIDIDQANNSSVVTSQYETLWAYEDKAVKVLNAIFTDYIKPNEISAWDSTPDKIRNTKLVSKWLLDIVTWRDLFSTQNILTEDMSKKDVNEFFSSNRRLDISNQDLMALQWMLITLKETNPKKLREIVDMIIVTQDEIWNEYINNVANNEKLKRAKRLLYNDPTQLYNIMNELLNDNTLWLDVYYWVAYEKSNKYKWINLNWLLNNIAQEYYNTRPKTATSENVWQLHEVYDKYFEIKVDWKDVKPSDEQINALSNLIDMYENRTSWWTLSIPGIAWTWKTTLLTAFFNYIMERWWAAQEVDNIAWKKQTVFINNFSPTNSKLLDKIRWDNNDHYIRVYNKESWGDVYIKFKWSALVPHYILEGRYNESKDKEWFLSKLSERFWWLRSNEWLMAIAEIWDNKYKDSWSKYTWMINNFEVVSKDDIPSWIKVMDIPWKQQKISARKWQSYWEISNNAEWLNDISFAVRMHSTVWSLKDVFVSQWWLAWLDIATIDSYLIQENKPLINDFWYETSYNIRPDRNSEWRVIIIDEAQNVYNTHLQALVDQLSEKNVIVFLWDYHQMSKWDYLKRNDNWSLYMIETHRWTDDINLVNDISSFTQQSLIDANAIWLYLTDSEDFVKYNNEDLRNLIPNDVKKTLMVCSKNVNRQAMNDMYIEQLWWMANITSNKTWKTIQAMIVDIESSERSQRNRKSEIPNEWLDMRWFKKYQWWNWYYKYNWNWIDIFFPSTKQTDVSDSEIASALSIVRWWTNKKTGKKYWKQEDWSYGWDISLYVPAFAITTEKESWKTVDNIILHEDITNTEYDFLSDKNVKQYYDAFTRWAKKVYLPQRSSRLIWITKQQAQDLRDWKWLTSATITNQQESISESTINIPSINNWSWNSSRTIDDMLDVIVNYFSVLNLPISDLIDELKDLWDIMNWMYLQSALTSADVEAIDKHWIWNNIQYINYQRQLQYRAAEIWDKIFNMISWNKNNIQVLNAAYWFDDNFLNKLESINWKVYWQTTKTPYIERKNSDKKLLYWQKKYANKKLDVQMINSLLADASSVAEWSLLEWTLYRPITKQDASWKFYTTLQSVKVNRDTKTKRWWINFWNDWARSAEAYDAMVRRINNDFTLAINEDNFEWTEEEFEQVRNEEIEKIFDNVDNEIWKISIFMQDNDLESVKDIIASSSSNEEYMTSQLWNMLDTVIELAQDRNYDDINEIKNLIIELNWYLISYDNWETTLWEIEWTLNTWEVAFNVSSAQDTINQEFTCE